MWTKAMMIAVNNAAGRLTNKTRPQIGKRVKEAG